MAISMRSVFAGLIKLVLFLAFYLAGYLTNAQLNQYTIVSQQDRINSLENETALQRLQINELNRRATSNTESIKQLTKIQQDLETLKSEVQRLHGLKETK
ncbi:hypothetical protein [Parasutterella sp.]|uniref:hypothetical protein n=1 Tax=Parasutterella sp. TaxID=2049037 RepID=UPI003AF1D2D4